MLVVFIDKKRVADKKEKEKEKERRFSDASTVTVFEYHDIYKIDRRWVGFF
jgi:hypothetical protein